MELYLRGHDTKHIDASSAIRDLREELSSAKFNTFLAMPEFHKLLDLFKVYKREDNGPMKSFCNSYLEMVSLLLRLIRATLEGNWSLHLDSIRRMLPWYFTYDHTNYARYLPVYLVQMMLLPDTHPKAQSMLENGDLGVQRTTKHGFAQLPVDQTID